ncbi:hypothetical protein [Aliihoeflea sp. PC F10.4]
MSGNLADCPISITNMTVRDEAMNAEQECLFIEWRDLHQKAQQTLDPADAHASGQAYRRFYESYLANTDCPSTKVVTFPRQHPDCGGTA